MAASAKRPRYESRFIEIPLADELFECIQGPFRSYVDLVTPEGQPYNARYHTYSNIVVGDFNDPKVEESLRKAFETYLHRLRDSVCPGLSKPKLFWRFRKGQHILIESQTRLKKSQVKLYTRLVVPDSALVQCQMCLHTEGEPHALHCENLVRLGDQYHAQ